MIYTLQFTNDYFMKNSHEVLTSYCAAVALFLLCSLDCPAQDCCMLKVPKREIFDRSDFPDFYTIKSSWVGDLVVKILTYYFNF
jgi:hypothetical protein